MRRYGCQRGYYRAGSACKRIEIPMLGSGRVPSVENRAGCKQIGGKWLDEYDICVMHDSCDKGSCHGWSAPIKGAVVSWSWMDWYEQERIPENKNVCMAEVTADLVTRRKKPHPQYEFLGPYEFAGWDPIFDMLVNEFYVFENCKHLQALTRDIGWSLAKAIKEGRAKDAWLSYVTPEGKPTSHLNRDAVVSMDPETVADVYQNLPVKKPFRLRRFGR